MAQRAWKLANPALAVGILLDGEGRLLCSSLADRLMGREWIHSGVPSDEILVEVAPEGGAPATLCGVSGWDLLGESTGVEGSWRSLTLSLASRGAPISVHRTWSLHRSLPILRQTSEIENTGGRGLDLLRADTFRLRLAPVPDDLQLRWLNNYCRGLKPRPSHPVHTRSVGENVRHFIETGPYSPDCAWFTLSIPGVPERGLVGGWEWSGPMAVGFGDWDGACLVTGGLACDGMKEPLPPGATFTVPGCWIGFYHGDIDEASELARRYTERIAPARVPWKRYPTLGYCSWADSLDGSSSPFVPAGTNPWFPTEENLLSQVDAAARSGFELYILDYGWFPRVGDWRCDPDRFPSGPGRIVRAVKASGMKLGLWMGFAAADPQSAVVREHPDWLATWDGAPIPDAFPIRCSAQVWNTRVLCLGHEPAARWATEQVERIVEEFEVDWLKHDFDTVTLCQSKDHSHTPGDGRIAICAGYYRLLDSVMERHPGTVIDNWESDSALPDFGMIRRHHVHLVGDAYSAFLLRQMFYGASRLFPPEMLHRYLRLEDSDLDMRASMRSAMVGGPLTILSDPRKWTPEQARVFKEEAALYRRFRGLFRRGTMYCPLGRPTGTGWDAFQFHEPKGGVVFVFRNDNPRSSIRIPLRGLERRARYVIQSVDGGPARGALGARLSSAGFLAELPERNSAGVYRYRRAAQEKGMQEKR